MKSRAAKCKKRREEAPREERRGEAPCWKTLVPARCEHTVISTRATKQQMSSQESVNSTDEREIKEFVSLVANEGWPVDEVRKAIRESRHEAEAWTTVRPVRHARMAAGSRKRSLELNDEDNSEVQRAIAESLGVWQSSVRRPRQSLGCQLRRSWNFQAAMSASPFRGTAR